MSENARLSFCENENTCVVCFKNVDIYSYGVCDHPVCFECSTRMRVLCRQNECPICRQDMPKVIFSREVEPYQTKIGTLSTSNALSDRRFGLIFCATDIKRFYEQLLEHNCYKCAKQNKGVRSFATFGQLKDHMRKEHQLFYCDLCVENLKIFTFERRCYNRNELGQHRRKGDSDNTSHRGHPLCEFCDTRYMDNDELYRHLRREHFFCHFCDADGKYQYYPSYADLRVHFQNEHFLCEEGDCINEQFTSVFRSDIDLKAHRASIHGRHLSKAATKQARTLELEFTLAPRQRPDMASRGERGNNRKPGGPLREREDEGAVGFNSFYMEPGGGPPPNSRPQKFVNTMNSEEFPSLSGSNAPVRPPSGVTITRTVRGAQALVRNNENFPALGDSSSSSGSGGSTTGTLRLSVNTSSNGHDRAQGSKGPNVSIHVNHKPNGSGSITTRITNQSSQNSSSVSGSSSSNNSNSVHIRSGEAFPALGTVKIPEAQWVSQRTTKEVKPKVSKVAPTPVLPNHDSRTDFPTLSSSKSTLSNSNNSTNNNNSNSNISSSSSKSVKKSSSVTVPVSNAWVNSASSTLIPSSSDTKPKSKKKKSSNNRNETLSLSRTNSHVDAPTTSSASTNSSSSKNAEAKKNFVNMNGNAGERVSSEGVIEMKSNGEIVKKLSELKIDNLEVSNFPALGKSAKKPPPGFSCPPPPGLTNHIKPQSSDLTFTNSSGQKFPILPAESRDFNAPPNFAQRNRTLIDRFVFAANSNEKIVEFKQQSDRFRNGIIDAQSYYEHCKQFLGDEFSEVFPELLALLPDIDKQQDLYTCYVTDKANSKSNKNKKSNSVDIEVCVTCKQVVLAKDLRHHLTNHNLESHFPALGNPSEISSSVWRK